MRPVRPDESLRHDDAGQFMRRLMGGTGLATPLGVGRRDGRALGREGNQTLLADEFLQKLLSPLVPRPVVA